MILRMVSALSFTAIGGIVGFSMSDKLKESCIICNEIDYLFQQAAFLITYKQDDVYAICRTLKANSELKNLTFLKNLPDIYKTGENFREIWADAVESQKNICSEEKSLLLHFGCILGKSDAEGQAESISAMQNELNHIREAHTENLLKKGRLYRCVGVLFGVMAGILVL